MAACLSADGSSAQPAAAAHRVKSLLLNGKPVAEDALGALALVNYGHYTTMQVRGGSVQGLGLHRQRLESATLELFGSALDYEQVRGQMRQAVAARPDCSLRVTVFSSRFDYRQPAGNFAVDVLLAAAPASRPVPHPSRVKSYRFARTLPHIKHVGTFPLFHHRRLALQAGCDDALFVDQSGAISEGSVWNVGFIRDGAVVWPNAPALGGTAAQLLHVALAGQGLRQEVREVRLGELALCEAAFACNSTGVWPIGEIDGVGFDTSGEWQPTLQAALASHAWETI